MTTRQILLHIGAPKCGSTYLQQVLSSNRTALAAAGVAYPPAPGGHPGNAAGLADRTAEEFEAMFAAAPAAGPEAVGPVPVRTIVFSHEDLFAQPRRGEALRAFAEATGTQVQVIVFLRPFSEFVYGDYSQFMKQHFERFLAARSPYDGRGFERFAVDRASRLSPLAYFRKWQSLFPELPLILRPHREIRGAVEPFLGGAAVDWTVPRDRANPSLRMADCDRIAAMIRDPSVPESEVREAFREAFHRVGEPDPGRTQERTAWLEAIFSHQNQGLIDEFGFDNRLMSAPEKPGRLDLTEPELGRLAR